MSSDVPDFAVIKVPPWLWDHAPGAFFEKAKLHARAMDAALGTWRVRPLEKERRTAPGLLDVHHLVGPGVPRRRFDHLDTFTGPRLRGPVTPREDEALRRREERAAAKGEVIDAFNYFQLLTALANQEELPRIAEHIYEELLDFPLEGTQAAAFPHSSVHVVRRRSELVHRVKMAGVLLRVEHDPELAAGNITPAYTALQDGSTVFSSSDDLVNGVYFLDLYFGPLLGALSPAIWGFHTPNEIGMMLYSVGRPLSGSRGDATEMLHLLPSRSPMASTPFPELPKHATREALDWWAARLDLLFGVLTNPAVFSDQDGGYVPVKHLRGLSTVEQLFKRVTSLQASHRDTTARNVILYSILDTLPRLTSRTLEKHCTLQFARETLARLEKGMPAAASEILLPGARRAVEALRQVQDGFFLLRQSGREAIDIVDGGRVVSSIKPELAAAEYIKILRNATHGFGSNRSSRTAITNTLLAHHDGGVPQDLPLLGYLYLLDVLSSPEVVARSLYEGGKG